MPRKNRFAKVLVDIILPPFQLLLTQSKQPGIFLQTFVEITSTNQTIAALQGASKTALPSKIILTGITRILKKMIVTC